MFQILGISSSNLLSQPVSRVAIMVMDLHSSWSTTTTSNQKTLDIPEILKWTFEELNLAILIKTPLVNTSSINKISMIYTHSRTTYKSYTH